MMRESTLCGTKIYNSSVGRVLLSWRPWWTVFMYPLDVFHVYIWERAQIKCFERRGPYKNTNKLIGRRFCQSHSERTNQISPLHRCLLWPAQRKSDGRFFKMELQDFRLKKSDPSSCLARLMFPKNRIKSTLTSVWETVLFFCLGKKCTSRLPGFFFLEVSLMRADLTCRQFKYCACKGCRCCSIYVIAVRCSTSDGEIRCFLAAS